MDTASPRYRRFSRMTLPRRALSAIRGNSFELSQREKCVEKIGKERSSRETETGQIRLHKFWYKSEKERRYSNYLHRYIVVDYSRNRRSNCTHGLCFCRSIHCPPPLPPLLTRSDLPLYTSSIFSFSYDQILRQSLIH